MQSITQFWKSGTTGKLVIGCGSLIVILLVCGCLGALLLWPKDATQQAGEEPATTQVVAEAEPTKTPEPTDTPHPTEQIVAEAEPTNTPEPTDTPGPTLTPVLAATPVLLGETVSFADWDYMVAEATVMTTIGDETPRGAYVVALLQVTNKGATERSIGSDFFVAQDAQGRLYEMDGDASLEYHRVYDIAYWYLDDIGSSLTGIVPVVFDVSPDSSSVLLRAAGVNEPTILLVEDVGGEPLTLPGEPLSTADWAYVVTDVSTASTIGDEMARGQYVAIILTVRNDGLTPREIGTQLFAFKDGEGRTYEMDSDASLEYHQTFDTNAWHLEPIGPSLDGIVPLVFDTATDASGFVLVTQEGTEVPLP